MPARKYTRMGEHSQGYECCNKKCKWQGTDADKYRRQINDNREVDVCPNCGNDEFYGLIKFNQNKETAP